MPSSRNGQVEASGTVGRKRCRISSTGSDVNRCLGTLQTIQAVTGTKSEHLLGQLEHFLGLAHSFTLAHDFTRKIIWRGKEKKLRVGKGTSLISAAFSVISPHGTLSPAGSVFKCVDCALFKLNI